MDNGQLSFLLDLIDLLNTSSILKQKQPPILQSQCLWPRVETTDCRFLLTDIEVLRELEEFRKRIQFPGSSSSGGPAGLHTRNKMKVGSLASMGCEMKLNSIPRETHFEPKGQLVPGINGEAIRDFSSAFNQDQGEAGETEDT